MGTTLSSSCEEIKEMLDFIVPHINFHTTVQSWMHLSLSEHVFPVELCSVAVRSTACQTLPTAGCGQAPFPCREQGSCRVANCSDSHQSWLCYSGPWIHNILRTKVWRKWSQNVRRLSFQNVTYPFLLFVQKTRFLDGLVIHLQEKPYLSLQNYTALTAL